MKNLLFKITQFFVLRSEAEFRPLGRTQTKVVRIRNTALQAGAHPAERRRGRAPLRGRAALPQGIRKKEYRIFTPTLAHLQEKKNVMFSTLL